MSWRSIEPYAWQTGHVIVHLVDSPVELRIATPAFRFIRSHQSLHLARPAPMSRLARPDDSVVKRRLSSVPAIASAENFRPLGKNFVPLKDVPLNTPLPKGRDVGQAVLRLLVADPEAHYDRIQDPPSPMDVPLGTVRSGH
jgi:hypothetical protein